MESVITLNSDSDSGVSWWEVSKYIFEVCYALMALACITVLIHVRFVQKNKSNEIAAVIILIIISRVCWLFLLPWLYLWPVNNTAMVVL